MNNYVQSYILNLSFPNTIEEMVYKKNEEGYFDVEAIVKGVDFIWTAPRWCGRGDIIFFTHAKTANAKISKLRSELNKNKDEYSDEEYNKYIKWLNEARDTYKKYNGHIFAYAQVTKSTFLYEDDDSTLLHWKSRLFVETSKVELLEKPLHVDDIKDYVFISKMSAITPLYGVIFDKIKERIENNNSITDYLREASATPVPLKDINKNNWMRISNEYRRKFLYESQFRHYYVDYLLKMISDKKSIYKECRCKKDGINDSFIDNVIFINQKYLPVEVKLNIYMEPDLRGQVRKYCYDNTIEIEKGKFIKYDEIHNNYVLVIDTGMVELYDYNKDLFEEIIDLNVINSIQDVYNLKELIVAKLI